MVRPPSVDDVRLGRLVGKFGEVFGARVGC
jgi:hypothetical protein